MGRTKPSLAGAVLAVGGAAPAVHRLVKKQRVEINVGRDFGVEISLVLFAEAGFLPLGADVRRVADHGGIFGQVNERELGKVGVEKAFHQCLVTQRIVAAGDGGFGEAALLDFLAEGEQMPEHLDLRHHRGERR